MMGGPTKIKKVHPNSHAVELGMEKGWILKSVGTEDVSKKSLQCAQNALKNATVALPM
jgi:NifB/MoaA-like Fe-S oxidoreductase